MDHPTPSPRHDAWDRLTAEDLRATGSLKWTAQPADIAAWVAESDLGTAPEVRAALHEAVERGALGYLPPAARTELGRATAALYRDRYGWEVDADRVHPVADVLQALELTLRLFSRPRAPVVVPTPAYMPFLTAPEEWGHPVVQVPMAEEDGRPVLDLDGIAAALRDGGHVVVLTNPHNPTGRVHTAAELAGLAEVVSRHGGRVFSDEIHAPLVLAGHHHVPYASIPGAAGHTVTATSASKAWNVPGLKCAQVLLSSEADARTWAPHDHLATHGASTLGVLASTAAYRADPAWLDDLLDYLDGNRRTFAAALAEHAPWARHRPSEGTYLAWVDVRDGQGDPARRLREEAGVTVVEGTACGEAGVGFVRVNLALPRPMVAELARRLGSVLDPRTAAPGA